MGRPKKDGQRLFHDNLCQTEKCSLPIKADRRGPHSAFLAGAGVVIFCKCEEVMIVDIIKRSLTSLKPKV